MFRTLNWNFPNCEKPRLVDFMSEVLSTTSCNTYFKQRVEYVITVRQAGVSFVFGWYFLYGITLAQRSFCAKDEQRLSHLLYMKDIIEGESLRAVVESSHAFTRSD